MPEFATGGMISPPGTPSPDRLPALLQDGGCRMSAAEARAIGDNLGLLKQINERGSLADLLEQWALGAIAEAATQISVQLGIPAFATELAAILQPQIQAISEEAAASRAAGESPEQFAERVAALNPKES